MSSGFRTRAGQGNARLRLVCLVVCFFFAALPVWAQDREEEIVANLAGGRVIMHVARDTIIFAAIDQPVEPHAIPPRVVGIDSGHIRSEEHTSELQSHSDLVCRLLLEKKKTQRNSSSETQERLQADR